ncbi:Fungal specific transcription factor domain-containing protein 77 [Elsinoe fawcettii]|nr:Fungal specific transcription factor domain-containing protein 77 [Elsinoe fawcettii]
MDPALSPPEANGSKRKGDDNSGQPRAKRNRYISIACNECKRRKIKCNGNSPCQRCGNLNLECVYAPNCCGTNFKDTEEFRQMNSHISSLQEQVDALFANVSSLRNELASSNPPLDPSLQTGYMGNQGIPSPAPMLSPSHNRTKSQSGPRPPTFRGPTSSAFSFDVAKSSLHTMGIAPENAADGDRTENVTPAGSPRLDNLPIPPMVSTARPQAKDPIWSVSRDEALRLLGVYEQEMHEMYPVVSMAHLRTHTNTLYKFIDAFFRASMMRLDLPGSDAIHDEDTNLLKLVLATALIVEGQGKSELGQRLFDCVQPQIDALLLGNAGLKEVRLLALAAMFHFHCDSESTSWRVIGLTARLCIELGLHRKETYENMSSEDRDSAILLFWSIHSLDRRWSFGTGLPFALQDSDIDPELPRPGENSLYLSAMIDYNTLGSKVWAAIGANHNESTMTRSDIGYLSYQVQQWHRILPAALQFEPSKLDQLNSPTLSNPGNLRLRIILYLRQNGMLINIYRPVLYSATSIMKNSSQAQEVVNVAKDTIKVLSKLNSTCQMYQTSQVLFNAFLTSALAVLFLAVSHAPASFADQVREEFYLALDLVRGFSKGSWVSKRVWRTIRHLKEVGPKLGLVTSSNGTGQSKRQGQGKGNYPMPNGTNTNEDDPSRSAALAMADLAAQGGQRGMDPFDVFPQTPAGWQAGSMPTESPGDMANDLTSLFEAAGALNGFASGVAGQNGFGQTPGPMGDMEGFGGEDELSRIMRDLF